MEMTFVPLALLGAAILLLVIFFYYVPFLLWISAKVSGVNISLIQLFLMRIRNVPPYVITRAMIEAHKAGLKMLTRDELEAHYLAGGHVEKVVHALVSASKANIDLPFQMATAIDLAGRDVFEAVQMSVNPKVIDTPPVTAVAKDGIQLIAKARVTVRANIKQLVGGAGEETILARVGEGIVSSIGSSENHKPRFHLQTGSPQRFGCGDCIRNLVHRHRRYRHRQEHRSLSANGPGSSRQEYRPGKGRRTSCYGRCCRTGNESQSTGSPCKGYRSRSRSTQGYGRSFP